MRNPTAAASTISPLRRGDGGRAVEAVLRACCHAHRCSSSGRSQVVSVSSDRPAGPKSSVALRRASVRDAGTPRAAACRGVTVLTLHLEPLDDHTLLSGAIPDQAACTASSNACAISTCASSPCAVSRPTRGGCDPAGGALAAPASVRRHRFRVPAGTGWAQHSRSAHPHDGEHPVVRPRRRPRSLAVVNDDAPGPSLVRESRVDPFQRLAELRRLAEHVRAARQLRRLSLQDILVRGLVEDQALTRACR